MLKSELMFHRIGCFLIILLCLAGCKRTSYPGDSRLVFRYNEASNISSLDPAFAKGQADIWACNQLFNGLVQMNDSLQIIPSIARSWEISEDGRTYTFYLRQDVFFHDHPVFIWGKGKKVTASDFVYSFNRILQPQLSSPGIWVFNSVAPSNPFEAINDTTFQIRLQNPFPPFLGLLTSQYCAVVPKEIVEYYGKEFRIHPIGTGPFKFKTWVERTNLIFLKNENYFETENGKRLPYLDAVSISFINDRQSAFLEFVKGNLDFVSGIDASYKDELLTRTGALKEKYRGKFKMETCAYLNTEYLGILCDPDLDIMKGNPLSDERVRKAINFGFDRRRMITYLRNGIGTPGVNGMIPPGLPSFNADSVTGYDYNPQLASQLLDEAGFPGGKNLPVITMSTTREYQDLCEFIQGQLSDIGIKIRLEVNQGATHREMVAKQQLAFFRGSWIADYPDAENYLGLFYSRNKAPVGPNYTHFSNAEYDLLYEQAGMTVNDSERYMLYREMDRIIIKHAPVVVLYYDQVVRLFQNNITDLGKNGMNLLSLKKVKKQYSQLN